MLSMGTAANWSKDSSKYGPHSEVFISFLKKDPTENFGVFVCTPFELHRSVQGYPGDYGLARCQLERNTQGSGPRYVGLEHDSGRRVRGNL